MRRLIKYIRKIGVLKTLLFAGVFLIVFLIALKMFLNAFLVMGPLNKPDFAAMEWEEFELVYWVRVGATKTEKRVIKITDDDTLNKLRLCLNVYKVSGFSMPAGKQIKIKMADGKEWQGEFVFEDRVDLCNASDTYYSYVIRLKTYVFYKQLLGLCLENEQKTTPAANRQHIILRRNLTLDFTPVLPEATRGRPYSFVDEITFP